MVMDVAWRMGNDFKDPGMFVFFEEAAHRSRKSLALWRLAYNEENLDGWASAGVESFVPDGDRLVGGFDEYSADDFNYQFLTLDEVTSGDFSMEAEVLAEYGQVTFAGLVFGRKSAQDFHAFVLYPPGTDEEGKEKHGYVDLTTFYGVDRRLGFPFRHRAATRPGATRRSRTPTRTSTAVRRPGATCASTSPVAWSTSGSTASTSPPRSSAASTSSAGASG